MRRELFHIALGAVALALLTFGVVPFTGYPDNGPELAPRLIGFGCEGATGPLYAVEESDFPRCARIEALAADPIHNFGQD